MAYGDKYKFEFTDFPGDLITIKIQGKDYTGTVEDESDGHELSARPLTVTMPNKSDLTSDFVMGQGCRIRIKNKGDLTKYDGLFGVGDREHKVVITKGNIKIFEGFVIPEVYTQRIKYRPDVIISANNKLADLIHYESDLLDPDTTDDFSTVTLHQLLKDILDSTGLELPIYVKNTLFSTLYAEAFDLKDTCYEKLKVNRQVFIDRDHPFNGREILTQILTVTGSRLYYYDGKWIIDRLRDIHEASDYKIYPILTDLEAYWSFDEAAGTVAYDNSGNGNDGTLVGSPTRVTGISGNALSFDGTNDYVTANMTAYSGTRTYSFWVYLPELDPAAANIVIQDQLNIDAAGVQIFFSSAGNGTLTISTRVATTGSYSGGPTYQMGIETWYHVTAEFTSTTQKLWVNGNFISQTISSYDVAYLGNLGIGARYDGSNKARCYIDEPRIYSRALTEEEIGRLYRTPVNHDGYELADENITAESGDLEYSAGKKLLRLIIDFDRYDNLVNSSFMGIQNNVTIGDLPRPPLGLWRTWTGIDPVNKSLSSGRLTSGIEHRIKDTDLTADQYYNAPITASIIIDCVSGFSWEVDYMYDWFPIAPVTHQNYRGGFRLRYQDNNGNWRFLAFVMAGPLGSLSRQLKLNSRFSDDIDYSAIPKEATNFDTGLYVLRWRPVEAYSSNYKWDIARLEEVGDATVLWESTKKDYAEGTPVYGDIQMESMTTTAVMTIPIKDPETVDVYSVVPGRPDWDIDHASENEMIAGLYRYNSYSHTAAGFYWWWFHEELTSYYKITGEQAKDNPGQQITASLSWDDISSWVISDIGYTPEQLEMYIDLMPMHRIDTPEEDNQWEPTFNERTYMGDVVVEQNSELSNNVIEGDLNTDFRDELEKRLRIYDGDYVNYQNTLLLTDSDGKTVRSRNWSDAYTAHEEKIHKVLLHDMAQQYNQPRHFIPAEINIRTAGKIVSPGSVFTYEGVLAGKKFVVLGYDYEVKMAVWRILVVEHKDYDEFTIV